MSEACDCDGCAYKRGDRHVTTGQQQIGCSRSVRTAETNQPDYPIWTDVHA